MTREERRGGRMGSEGKGREDGQMEKKGVQ